MKTTHLVASALFLGLLLTGCAHLPMDQCRAGIEKESKVLDVNGHAMQYHRSPDFAFLLSAAEDDELIGDYQGCLNNLQVAHVNQHERNRTRRNSGPMQDSNSWGRQNQGNQGQSNRGSANDAAHHSAGHTHHHGHD